MTSRLSLHLPFDWLEITLARIGLVTLEISQLDIFSKVKYKETMIVNESDSSLGNFQSTKG